MDGGVDMICGEDSLRLGCATGSLGGSCIDHKRKFLAPLYVLLHSIVRPKPYN